MKDKINIYYWSTFISKEASVLVVLASASILLLKYLKISYDKK